MFGLLVKIKQVRDLVKVGSYEEAGRLVYEIIGEVTGWAGRSATDGTAADLLACQTECEGLVADCGDQGRAAGGAVVLALLQLAGPFLLELLKKRIEERS